MRDLLAAYTHLIPRDPQQRGRACDGWIVECVPLDLRGVVDICEIFGDEAAEGEVVGVNGREEPFDDEVGFLVGRGGEGLARGCELVAVGGADTVLAVVIGGAVCRSTLQGHECFFFYVQRCWERVQEGVDGAVEGDVEEDGAD